MAGGPAVRLYRAEWSTNCERVGMALAHKGIEAQSVLIEYSNRRPVEEISGQGLVPVIEDAGEVIHDSVAIMRHLERRTPEPPLWPADPADRAGVDVFIGWFERVYKAAPNAIEAELERDDPDDALIERLGSEMTERLDVFEGLLDRGDHLVAGQLTAADLVAYPFLKYAAHRDPADTELFHVILADHQPLGDSHPRLREWIERIGALPRAY
jgi:glutathione S-transferase